MATSTSLDHDSHFPVILVIGDFEFNHESRFGYFAWERIESEFRIRCAPATLPFRPKAFADTISPEECQSALIRMRGSIPNPPDHTTAIPIPLSHGREIDSLSKTFTSTLFRYLSSFNVVAIICCGPAAQAEHIESHLSKLQHTLILSAASTVGTSDRSPNVCQLIPNNDLQAQAIVSCVLQFPPSLRYHPLYIYGYRPTDRYIRDLHNAVNNQLRLVGLSEATFLTNRTQLSTIDASCVLINIGYPDSISHLVKRNRSARGPIILSDGCFRKSSLTLIPMTEDDQYYWTRPVVLPEDYALHAYNAVCAILDGSFHATRPASRHAHKVAEYLDKTFTFRFTFAGGSNSAGGYIVERFTKAVHDKFASAFAAS